MLQLQCSNFGYTLWRLKMVDLGNIFILGDSYSTFEGHIPEGFDAYYLASGPAYKCQKGELDEGDVFQVNETWWYDLCNENGNLLRNCSWSGTTICNTGYNQSDNSKCSFIARFDNLAEEGYLEKNKVDTLFLFGGTNDSWAGSPIGELKYDDYTKEDLYSALPAFGYLMESFKKYLKGTKIYCIINTELKEEITDAYKEACKKYGVDVIELQNIDKQHGHPTILGMKQIKEQVLGYINK